MLFRPASQDSIHIGNLLYNVTMIISLPVAERCNTLALVLLVAGVPRFYLVWLERERSGNDLQFVPPCATSRSFDCASADPQNRRIERHGRTLRSG